MCARLAACRDWRWAVAAAGWAGGGWVSRLEVQSCWLGPMHQTAGWAAQGRLRDSPGCSGCLRSCKWHWVVDGAAAARAGTHLRTTPLRNTSCGVVGTFLLKTLSTTAPCWRACRRPRRRGWRRPSGARRQLEVGSRCRAAAKEALISVRQWRGVAVAAAAACGANAQPAAATSGAFWDGKPLVHVTRSSSDFRRMSNANCSTLTAAAVPSLVSIKCGWFSQRLGRQDRSRFHSVMVSDARWHVEHLQVDTACEKQHSCGAADSTSAASSNACLHKFEDDSRILDLTFVAVETCDAHHRVGTVCCCTTSCNLRLCHSLIRWLPMTPHESTACLLASCTCSLVVAKCSGSTSICYFERSAKQHDSAVCRRQLYGNYRMADNMPLLV